MTPIEKRKEELKAFIDLGKDFALTKGFDHPCSQTCSGWTQGRERGRLDAARIAEELLVAIEALEKYRGICLVEFPTNVSVFTANKALARIAG